MASVAKADKSNTTNTKATAREAVDQTPSLRHPAQKCRITNNMAQCRQLSRLRPQQRDQGDLATTTTNASRHQAVTSSVAAQLRQNTQLRLHQPGRSGSCPQETQAWT
jgi:hypothetical protein